MLYSRARKLIGLSLVAAFAATAFAAATAQADDWLIEISPGVHQLVTSFRPYTSRTDARNVLHASVGKEGATTVEIECEEETGEGGLEEEGKASGTFKYSKCKTLLNKSPSAVCKPSEPIETKIKAELFSHEKEDYVLVSPASGTTFTKIKFPNEECVLSPEQSVTGTLVFRDCQGMGMALLVEHLLERVGGTLFSSGAHIDALKFGASTASLTGSNWIRLAGADAGRRYKAMATGVL